MRSEAIIPQTRKINYSLSQVEVVDFVGPVCESGDWLGKDRTIVLPEEGDLYAVMDAGAYCMAMASNYNLRARPAEVLIHGGEVTLIQARETYEEVVKKNVGRRRSRLSSSKMVSNSSDSSSSAGSSVEDELPSSHLIGGRV